MIIVNEENYWRAWCKLILETKSSKGDSPAIISISSCETNSSEVEKEIQNYLDKKLQSKSKISTNDVAYTIFPQQFWELKMKEGREVFYKEYSQKILPRMKARFRANAYGTYFDRIINFQGVKKNKISHINQLEHIIHCLTSSGKKRRATALQIAIFNPNTDHTEQPVRGFPCLQQISLNYNLDGLTLTALYPAQYLVAKAFGNYKGICQLASFISQFCGIKINKVNILITQPKLDMSISKNEMIQIQGWI
ncbi:hypothetical protein EHQ47_17165 [Leptospira bourretii]|uniref:hypothetical protein n=1 Tax=Leptospira bourretii TaxID=2484962 RepID=UPI00109156CD|nr:hypothetical protein [Leptospira bourretii]TGL18565.1 hypothetical protein EHQ47_17165 [Leptospira bourretii]